MHADMYQTQFEQCILRNDFESALLNGLSRDINCILQKLIFFYTLQILPQALLNVLGIRTNE